MCYVVKSLSKNGVADSTCPRCLYMTSTTPTRVRVRDFGPTVATMPHKPILEVKKAVRRQKNVKKGWFFSHFMIFFARGTFQRLLVVSIAYQNFWHKILGRLRPLPTMCGALGSHRIEKTLKNPLRFHPFGE